MIEEIIINNTGNFAHALPIKAKKNNFQVSFFSDRSPEKIDLLSRNNKIEYIYDGLYAGEEVKINTIKKLEPNNFKKAKYFILSNYATEHKSFFKKYGKYLNKNHEIVLISPGVGAALEMNSILKKYKLKSFPKLTEVDTSPFACKVPKIGKSYIKNEKKEILYTSIQGYDDQVSKTSSLVSKLFNYAKFIDTPYMNLDDSTCFHVVGMVVNSNRIKNSEDFNFYINDNMEKSSDLMFNFDKERCMVANKLNVPYRDIKTWLNLVYDVEIKDSLYEMIKNTPPYMNSELNSNRSPAPKTLNHRYLEEEIPLKVVPTYYLGKSFGLDMKLHERFIKESGKLLFNDESYYFKYGRIINY